MSESWHPRKTEKDVAVARAGVAKYDRGWKYGAGTRKHDHSKPGKGGEVLNPENINNTAYVTDETELQSALNNYDIVVTVADFDITSTVTIPDNTKLIFNSTVRPNGIGSNPMIENGDTTNGNTGIVIEGGDKGGWHIDGNNGDALYLIKLTHCENSVMEGIRFKDCQTGLEFDYGKYNKLNNNFGYNVAVQGGVNGGIRPASDYSECKNNIVYTSGYRCIAFGGTTTFHGLEITGNVTLDSVDFCMFFGHVTDSLIQENYANGYINGNQATGGGIGIREPNHCSVLNNIAVNNYYHGITLGAHAEAGDTVKHNLVANNLAVNNNQQGLGTGERDGINVRIGNADECSHNSVQDNIAVDTQATKTQARGVRTVSSTHSTITGNICAYNGVEGMSVGGDYSVVSGNYCYRNNQRGMYVAFRRGKVTDNMCVENSQESAGTYDGIYLNSSENVVTGNNCTDWQATPTQRYGIYPRVSNYNIITNNNCEGNASGGIAPYEAILAGSEIRKDNIPLENVFKGLSTDANGQVAVTFDFAMNYKPVLDIALESNNLWYISSWSTDVNGNYTGATIQVTDTGGTAVGSGVTVHVRVESN